MHPNDIPAFHSGAGAERNRSIRFLRNTSRLILISGIATAFSIHPSTVHCETPAQAVDRYRIESERLAAEMARRNEETRRINEARLEKMRADAERQRLEAKADAEAQRVRAQTRAEKLNESVKETNRVVNEEVGKLNQSIRDRQERERQESNARREQREQKVEEQQQALTLESQTTAPSSAEYSSSAPSSSYSSSNTSSNSGSSGHENIYSGSVGRTAAKFRLRFEDGGGVTGTYSQDGKTYRLEGNNPQGSLMLFEYTGEQRTARLELSLRDSDTEIRWEGTMYNISPNNNTYPVSFSRPRQ